jgi:hypothetical protein
METNCFSHISCWSCHPTGGSTTRLPMTSGPDSPIFTMATVALRLLLGCLSLLAVLPMGAWAGSLSLDGGIHDRHALLRRWETHLTVPLTH